jgi:porin
MTSTSFKSAFFFMVLAASTSAQTHAPQGVAEAGAPDETKAPSAYETQDTNQPGAKFSPFKLEDYSGDLRTRSRLTGDWDSARTSLAEDGITFDVNALQVLQGNAHGGKHTHGGFRYSGSVDYALMLDTGRMGLWPGGRMTLRGETQIGQSINKKVGSIIPVNYSALLPEPDNSGATTLSEAYLTQVFSKEFILVAGKLDLAHFADQNEFAEDEKTQFMNAAFRANPGLSVYVPYTVLGTLLICRPTDWFSFTTIIHDPNSSATRSGFDTAFHSPEGMTLSQEYHFKVKPFGQTGHQRFGIGWDSKDRTELSEFQKLQMPRPLLAFRAILGLLPDIQKRPDSWGVWYNFDQYLYTEPEDESQGVGLFGRLGWSDGQVNPVETFYSIGVGGRGAIPSRDNDTFGIGYYYLDMSDDLRPFGLTSEQGIEAYYNIEITPWLHITPDFQVIVDPGAGFDNRDVAIVYGLRSRLRF